MRSAKAVLLLSLTLAAPLAIAQQAPTGAAATSDVREYNSKVKRLNRGDVDALLAKPDKVLFIELRRPDQVTADGSFPVYLAILSRDLEKNLAYIPKDRALVTVGLHARYAGAAGDLLVSKGYTVAGAVGVEEYIEQGGTITKIAPPPPKTAAVVQ